MVERMRECAQQWRQALSLLFLLSALILLGVSPVAHASVAWPTHDAWQQAVKQNHAPLGDPILDFNGAQGLQHLDIVTDTSPGTGSAFAWAFDGEHLFFRIVLRDNPLHNSGKGQLKSHTWQVYVNTEHPGLETGFHADYAIVLYHGEIRTKYADPSKPVSKDLKNWGETGFSSHSSAHSQAPTASDPYRYIYHHASYGYMVRVANAAQVVPGGASDRWYLEFFVPMEWLSAPAGGGSAPAPIEAYTGVRFAVATSTQDNNTLKDEAGLGSGDRFVALYAPLRPPVPQALQLIAGDGQAGAPGQSLSQPLVVRVVDADGDGVGGVPVTFAVEGTPAGAVGAGLGTSQPLSDEHGYVEVDVTLGDRMGIYSIAASADGLDGSPLYFTLYAWNGEPVALRWEGPASGVVGEELPLQLVVINAAGEPTLVRTPTTLALQSNHSSGSPFFALDGVSPIDTLVLPPGDERVSLLYRETKAGLASLTATATAGEAVGSAVHDVTLAAGEAAALVFIEQPQDADVLDLLQPVVLEVQDAYGNPVAAPSEGLTISVEALRTGEAEPVLLATAPWELSGQAVFGDLRFNLHGEYRLHASAAGLPAVISEPFTIWGSDLTPSSYRVTPTGSVRRGEQLTYTARLENVGNRSTEELTLVIRMPAHTSLERLDTSDCRNASLQAGGAELHCELPPLLPEASVLITFDVKVGTTVPNGTELTSEASLHGSWDDALPIGEVLRSVVMAPDVRIHNSVSPNGQVSPGEVVTVRVDIENRGGAAATDVVVRYPLPESLVYVAGSVSGPETATVHFQDDEGAWYESEWAEDGTPRRVVAIRWLVPVLEAESTEAFIYRVLVP